MRKPTAPAPQAARIALLDYPGAQRAALHGLADLFETAARLDQQRGAPHARIEAHVVTRKDCRACPSNAYAAVILPPCLVAAPGRRDAAPFVAWLREQHRRGTRLCSVCAGAFVLAETGLLGSRPATTHWALADTFAQRFPDVRLDVAKLLIDDGDVITAGGVMAWIDLGLRLIERFTTPAVMIATARMFLVDPAGREQRHYSDPAPRVSHGDAPILRVQLWMNAHHGDRLSTAAMCGHAGMGERTFLRRFQAATGLTPTAYLQQLRVSRARALLESSGKAIDQVAWSVGYEDPSAFRKIFQRIVGLSPGEYRRRFVPATAAHRPIARRTSGVR